MKQYFALIKNGVVDNVIVANAAFVEKIRPRFGFDEAVDVTSMDPRPVPGWPYADGAFTDPMPEKMRASKLDGLRKKRDSKISEVDIMIKEITLGIRTDIESVKAYRQTLLDITEQFKNPGGGVKDSILDTDIDAEDFWPAKPQKTGGGGGPARP